MNSAAERRPRPHLSRLAAPLTLALCAALSACGSGSPATGASTPAQIGAQAVVPSEWIRGVDVSEARAAESAGVSFKDRPASPRAPCRS